MPDRSITELTVSKDPRHLVLAIEKTVQALCESVGKDAADGTMVLFTTAVHVAMRHSKKPAKDIADVLADCLGHAIVAADEWFKP